MSHETVDHVMKFPRPFDKRAFLLTLDQRTRAFADWFIPARLKASNDLLQGVRMFLCSHLFGPFLGHTISLYMLFIQGHADWHWWVFFAAVTLFWPFPIMLRITGWYVPLALVSIQNLIFCILWGCYHYGGVSSPILPWLITVPLLAFFYLPNPRTRIVVALMIVANLVAFYLIYSSFGFPETVPLSSLVGLGLVSTFCAGVYVSMMALYYAKIVSSQTELEQEAQRHRETERQLRDATEQVERATRAKSEFLAKMSHELRNPLNAIIGYSELLIGDLPTIGDQKSEDLKSIKGAGYKLLGLVNDLLDLSKLEAGKLELHLEKFDLADFIGDLVSEWRAPIAANANELQVNCPPELGDMVGDAAKLRRAVGSLLSNAAKFTKHGRVTLTVSQQDNLIVISVRDTGRGMGREQLTHLFETFGTTKEETSSNYGDDPGLGLPLTHRLCRLMGGDLAIESNPGRGSCSTIRLPCSRTSEDEHLTIRDEPPVVDAAAA
jgi:signal transduction histidine kinase